ncbi:hypothetical protein [Desulfobacula sp.]
MVTPDLLRKIANVSEKYNAKALKITGAARIAIIGLKEDDIDLVWEDLGLDSYDWRQCGCPAANWK